MTVSNATSSDSSVISSLLNDHFLRINTVFGYNRLKSGTERLNSIILGRINDPESQFKYFVLREGSSTVGFVNLMLTKEISEILVLLIKDEFKTQENVELLLNYSIKQFKNLGIYKFLTEINTPDEEFRNLILKKGARILSAFYEINL